MKANKLTVLLPLLLQLPSRSVLYSAATHSQQCCDDAMLCSAKNDDDDDEWPIRHVAGGVCVRRSFPGDDLNTYVPQSTRMILPAASATTYHLV